MWFTSSSGFVELQLTRAEAEQGNHPGQCDGDVLELSRKPRIARQLRAIDPGKLKEELREYGAWDDEELADHEQNLQRILWIACGDICEEIHQRRTAS